MKWTVEQIEQLKTLSAAGVSNKEIAGKLHVTVEQVYRKRSALGITIKKMQPHDSSTDIVQGDAAKTDRACPCYACAAWCRAAGLQQVVINCPKYVSPARRRAEYLRKAKREFLEALYRTSLPGGHDLIARSEYQELCDHLDKLIPEQKNTAAGTGPSDSGTGIILHSLSLSQSKENVKGGEKI